MASSKPKILIVDDMSAFARVTQMFLEKHGYEVATAGNGQAALERLAGWTPDVMLVDVQMPGMSGFQLLDAVQEAGFCKGTKILVLTGRTDPMDASKARSRGAVDIMHKPYTKESLLARLQELGAVPEAS